MKIEEVITKLGELPAMPLVVSEVLNRTEDPTISLSEVSEIIQQDPALTAKILKVSNSPYYGMRQVVGTLKLALVILGVREIRNIVLGISVVDALRDDSTDRLLREHGFWEHSALVAGISKKLGSHLKLNFQGEDFIAGLLHDIGKMVLWRQLKGDYERVFLTAHGGTVDLCKLERTAYGFDHADAAAALANRWNLPETLADAVRCHHSDSSRRLADAKDPQLAAVVRVANLAAHDEWDAQDAKIAESCADEEAWEILSKDGSLENIDDRQAMLSPFCAEIREMPRPSF